MVYMLIRLEQRKPVTLWWSAGEIASGSEFPDRSRLAMLSAVYEPFIEQYSDDRLSKDL